MVKQKRDITQDQLILTGQFLRLAQRMGRIDLTPMQDDTTVKTALNQLKSAVKVAQNAYEILLAASVQERALPMFTHPGVPDKTQQNGTQRKEPMPQRPFPGRTANIGNDVHGEF